MPKSYKINDEVFDIPDAEVAAFLKDNPNAEEINSFVVGKDTFDIPIPEVEAFRKENPQAKPLGAKKKWGRLNWLHLFIRDTGTEWERFYRSHQRIKGAH